MRKTTLRTVSLHTVANYRRVAERTVAAYRGSGHRLLAMMGRNFERSTTRSAPQWLAALRRTSALLNQAAVKGIDKVSAQTERVIEIGSDGVSAQIERIADLVQGIENRYIATGLQAAARASLGGAQTALTLSEKLAAGADKLASVVGGKYTRGTRAVVRAKSAVKAARRAAAPVRARAPKPTAVVAKRVKAAPRKPAAQPEVSAEVAVAAKPKARRRAAPKAEPVTAAA